MDEKKREQERANDDVVERLREKSLRSLECMLEPRKKRKVVRTERLDSDGEVIFTEEKVTEEDLPVEFALVKFVVSRLESDLFRKEERDLLKARVRAYDGFEDMVPELSAEEKVRLSEEFIQENLFSMYEENVGTKFE